MDVANNKKDEARKEMLAKIKKCKGIDDEDYF